MTGQVEYYRADLAVANCIVIWHMSYAEAVNLMPKFYHALVRAHNAHINPECTSSLTPKDVRRLRAMNERERE